MRLTLGPIDFRATLVDKPTQFYDSSFPPYIDLFYSVIF